MFIFAFLANAAGASKVSKRSWAMIELTKNWRQLAREAIHERDPEKLIALANELQKALQREQFAHPSQTDAGFRADSMKQPQTFFGYTLPEIPHLQNDSLVYVLKMDARFRRSGVAMHIGQALLQHTEQCDLYLFRQSSMRIRKIRF